MKCPNGRFHKYFHSSFTLCLFVLVIAGCSSNKPESSSDNKTSTPAPAVSPSSKTPVKLQLLTWSIGQRQALIDKFHEKYPWITIEVNSKINGGIIKNVIAGEPADLVFLDNGLTEWMSGDLLEDMTPYVAKDLRIQSAAGAKEALEAFKTGGKQWAIPFSDSPMYIFVNKDMLAKYGMTMPRNDWTYDDLLEMAKKATQPAANDWGMIGMVDEFTQTLAIANGSADNYRYMNKDNTKSLADTPQVLADLKWSQELTTKWNVRPSLEEAKKLGIHADARTAFLNGNFLFTHGTTRNAEANKEAKFQWDVLPMPKGKARQVTVHQAGPVAIPKASKHKEEAFLFISFLFDLEAQKTMISTGQGALADYPELKPLYADVAIWKGKNLEAVTMTETLCCFSRDTGVMDLGTYVGKVQGPLAKMVTEGGNFNSVIQEVEAYNKQADITRKALGW